MFNPIYHADIKSDFSLHVRFTMDENFLFMHLLSKCYEDASLCRI